MSNIRDFGAKGDGRSDDTDAVQHAIEATGGFVEFPPGDYLLTRTVTLNLPITGRAGLTGSAGAAKITWRAPERRFTSWEATAARPCRKTFTPMSGDASGCRRF